jgi:hypothetical protein
VLGEDAMDFDTITMLERTDLEEYELFLFCSASLFLSSIMTSLLIKLRNLVPYILAGTQEIMALFA